jgi:hypothetical protein
LETISSTGNLKEVIIFYHPLKTGVKFLDKLLSSLKYKTIYRAAFKKYFKQEGLPDLVHVHVAMKAGLQALYLKNNFKIPYILTEHWSGFYADAAETVFSLGRWFTHFSRKILKNAMLVLPVADYLRKAINSFEKINYEVVPNVVNTSFFFTGSNRFRPFGSFIFLR